MTEEKIKEEERDRTEREEIKKEKERRMVKEKKKERNLGNRLNLDGD